jgi:hypothetical protein
MPCENFLDMKLKLRFLNSKEMLIGRETLMNGVAGVDYDGVS